MTSPDAAPGWIIPTPERSGASKRRWAIGCLLALVLAAAVIGGAAFLFARTLGTGLAVIANSGGEIETFHAFSNGPTLTVTFQAARGLDVPDGPRLACDVVRPALVNTDWANARWEIVNRAGDVMASDKTPCP